MKKNVEIKSERVLKYISENKNTFSKEVFFRLVEQYVDALSNGALLFVKVKERANSAVYRVGYVHHGFNHLSLLFAAFGYKTNITEIVIPFTGGQLVNDTNRYICERLFKEGILDNEEFERLASINVASV